MSVIGEFAVLPNRVEVVYRYLQSQRDGEERKDLAALLSPPALQRTAVDDGEESGGNATVDQLLRACQKLGVTVSGEDGRIRVAAQLRTDRDDASPKLLRHLETVLLSPAAAADADQADFPRTLAWFLTEDPAVPLELGNVKNRVEQQLGHDVDVNLSNLSRFQNFVYWARYLGCAWRFQANREWVVPDPTRILERHLPNLLVRGERLPLSQLLDRWRGSIPVLEGGEARIAVERSLRDEYRRPDGQLSRSTSLALVRLRDRGVIQLDALSDATSLLLDTWPAPMPVSHVTLMEAHR